MRIGIVDYKAGNIRSIVNALTTLGATDLVIADESAKLDDCDKIVLPGVGAFGAAMENLNGSGLADALTVQKDKGKPILGICLGMQLVMEYSLELGEHKGLGWIKGGVKPFPRDMGLAIPHVGWNEARKATPNPLTNDLPDEIDVYYVHSFYVDCDDATDAILTCDYGIGFTAAVARGNVMATQFHPEKSQRHGLKILENFLGLPC